ncbi:hypothetical protein [Marinicella meishanensis]|uniref:hypothetical protein n=1 Tax=Marinicella meishanensis TaxID=2873263 RepID=UPI001CC13983|nr:hypothetical protein [Marinicella sp. NBU2979]
MQRHIITWALSLGLLSTASLANDIQIDYPGSHQAWQLRHCFQQAPAQMQAHGEATLTLTADWQWQGRSLTPRGRRLALPAGEAGCLQYTVKPRAGNHNQRSSRFRAQHPDSLLLSVDDWQWQASDQSQRQWPQVTINHPADVQVSAPWQLLKRSARQTHYQMKPSPSYANGFLAMGPMQLRTLALGESRLRLAIMAGNHTEHSDLLSDWVKQMAASVARVGESFPLPEVQVLVVLMTGSQGPVPWGQVNRAGGQGVLLVVNPESSRASLFADWTAAHEFSHLLMPYTPYDRWLSEGFASYHQNITRMRVGLLDEPTAWSKLIAGFERGQRTAQQRSAPVLKEAGRRHNMQMYWGGAVFALKADVALQQQSGGRMSLSKTLAGLQDCCLDTGRSWTARSLFQEMDRISASTVFTRLYEQEVKRAPFMEYADLLRELGIERNAYGRIRFNDQAPKALIRQRISLGY